MPALAGWGRVSSRVQIKVSAKSGLVWFLGERDISRSLHPNHHVKGWVHMPSHENTAHV